MSSCNAIDHFLIPFQRHLQTDGVTELCVNRPGEIWVECFGQFQAIATPELTIDHLEGLAQLVASHNNQFITQETPTLSGALPGGERIEILRSPACEAGKMVISIRRQQIRDLTLADYLELGAFAGPPNMAEEVSVDGNALLKLYQEKNYHQFLELAIKSRKNILLSGGTGTGKTTFLNACLKTIPMDERLISIEDTREVNIPQPNSAHLLAPKANQGISEVKIEQLFESCLRLRPDRILLSEIRGPEVFSFLEAINSGHPGSLSTVHADTPMAAFNQLYRKMRRFGDKSEHKEALEYLQSIIPIIVQVTRCPTPDRHMYISDVYFNEACL